VAMAFQVDGDCEMGDHGAMNEGRIATEGVARKAVWAVFLIVLGVGLAFVLRVLAPFFAVILLALVASGLLYRRFVRLSRKLGGRPRLAAIILCLALVAAVLVPLTLTIQAVSVEAQSFYGITTTQLTEERVMQVLEKRQAALDRVNAFLTPLGVEVTAEDLYRSLAALGVRIGPFFYLQGVDLAKGLARLLLGFCFWVLILYYLLIDGEALQQWFFATLPLPDEQQVLLCRRFTDMAASLVVGNGLAGLIQGVCGGLVFALVGLPGPVLWGVVMAILAFIPVIGISLVYIPAAIILMLMGRFTEAFLILIPLAILATVVEYWLKPILVGRRAQMHTMLVFLALLGGFDAFGPVGLLLGPLMMTAFLTLATIYREHYLPPAASEAARPVARPGDG
jgi:predicted PurR-regulated permease PerM